jgi:hypothetical protein
MTTHKGTGRATGARVEGPIKAGDGTYFWRRFSANGREVARSSETYEHRQHALDQAFAEADANGMRLFEPGYNTDGTGDVDTWVEVEPRPSGA